MNKPKIESDDITIDVAADALVKNVERLMAELLRPSFVFTMARGMNRPQARPGQQRSAVTRQRNAAAQIDDIVQRYVTGGLL